MSTVYKRPRWEYGEPQTDAARVVLRCVEHSERFR